MILATKGNLLAAVMLLSIAPAYAQYGRNDDAPRNIVEPSRQTGGYCDRAGCPNQFWKYRIFYGPVYYHGRWFRGPVYAKDDYGRNLFWVAGGWHRDEWHAKRPRWTRNAYFGPPQSRDYYRTGEFFGGDRYGNSGGQPRDWRDARQYGDSHASDGGQGYLNDRRFGSNGTPRNDANGLDRQNDGRQYQGSGSYGMDQRSQYGNRQSDSQNTANRQANGGAQNFNGQQDRSQAAGSYGQGQRSQYGGGQNDGNRQAPGFGQNIQGGGSSGQNIAQVQGQTGSISITMATYGGRSCKAANGNLTQPLRTACNGKATCQYTVDPTVIGDPAQGCAKDFEVDWTCGTSPGGRASLPGEAAGGKVNLSCPASAR